MKYETRISKVGPISYYLKTFSFRWTTGFGEPYDYNSIMHYSSRAFSKDPYDNKSMTIESINPDRSEITGLGRKRNLSETDVIKIKKLYKCSPYENWYVSKWAFLGKLLRFFVSLSLKRPLFVIRDNGCQSDSDCGINEHCAASINVIKGQCRTQLPDGSLCTRNEECLHRICSGGICSSCTQDEHCPEGQFCGNKYIPFVENVCTEYCGELCLFSAQCLGRCTTCGWGFVCE